MVFSEAVWILYSEVWWAVMDAEHTTSKFLALSTERTSTGMSMMIKTILKLYFISLSLSDQASLSHRAPPLIVPLYRLRTPVRGWNLGAARFSDRAWRVGRQVCTLCLAFTLQLAAHMFCTSAQRTSY
jgi:hypothetical protein